jgi:RNA polymerase sigma-70 factor (ECF subfamily)
MSVEDDVKTSDATLLRRTAAGDRAAFESLVKRHQAAVYRFARALSGNPENPATPANAEEALQEAFLAAWRGAARFRDEASARPRLLTLARQALARRQAPGGEPDSTPLRELGRAAGWGHGGGGFAADRLAGLSDPGLLEEALGALPSGDREILILRDLEKLPADEAAAVAGVTPGAARTRLHRARLRLMARGSTLGRSTMDGERIVAGLHCGEVLADLSDHLDGALPKDRARRVEEHLRGCEACERFYAELSALADALRERIPEPGLDALDAEVAARLHARLAVEAVSEHG